MSVFLALVESGQRLPERVDDVVLTVLRSPTLEPAVRARAGRVLQYAQPVRREHQLAVRDALLEPVLLSDQAARRELAEALCGVGLRPEDRTEALLRLLVHDDPNVTNWVRRCIDG